MCVCVCVCLLRFCWRVGQFKRFMTARTTEVLWQRSCRGMRLPYTASTLKYVSYKTGCPFPLSFVDLIWRLCLRSPMCNVCLCPLLLLNYHVVTSLPALPLFIRHTRAQTPTLGCGTFSHCGPHSGIMSPKPLGYNSATLSSFKDKSRHFSSPNV